MSRGLLHIVRSFVLGYVFLLSFVMDTTHVMRDLGMDMGAKGWDGLMI